jgi:hypothetical protein
MSGRVSDTGTLAIEEVDTDDMRTRRLKTDHARSRQAMRKRCSPPPSDLLVVQSGSESGGLRECRIHAGPVAWVEAERAVALSCYLHLIR